MESYAVHSAQILSEEEEILIGKIKDWLNEKSPHESVLVNERFQLLRNLGKAVFDYPSIKDTQFLKGIIRDENQLTESLLDFSSASRLLRTPAKIVALRSFLVAKFHAFSLLSQLAIENSEFQTHARNIAFSVIFTLMAENVYFSCLDDPGFSSNTKSRLVDDLIALWDSGKDPRSLCHLTALTSLWSARDSSPPSFGTMDGNTEVLRISIDMEGD
jgi:hypothetical protein